MTDRKISELVAVTSVDDADEFVLARSGSSNKITGANMGTSLGGSQPSFARVQQSTAIDPWDGSTIPFDVVTVDADELWDATNHQYVAKRAGWYAVSAYANGSSSEGGVWKPVGSNAIVDVVAVVFGAGDNLQTATVAHAEATVGIWVVPPLYGHTRLGIGDAVVIQGSGGVVPGGFTFALYGPVG